MGSAVGLRPARLQKNKWDSKETRKQCNTQDQVGQLIILIIIIHDKNWFIMIITSIVDNNNVIALAIRLAKLMITKWR